jgi:hypothetical protein
VRHYRVYKGLTGTLKSSTEQNVLYTSAHITYSSIRLKSEKGLCNKQAPMWASNYTLLLLFIIRIINTYLVSRTAGALCIAYNEISSVSCYCAQGQSLWANDLCWILRTHVVSTVGVLKKIKLRRIRIKRLI